MTHCPLLEDLGTVLPHSVYLYNELLATYTPDNDVIFRLSDLNGKRTSTRIYFVLLKEVLTGGHHGVNYGCGWSVF